MKELSLLKSALDPSTLATLKGLGTWGAAGAGAGAIGMGAANIMGGHQNSEDEQGNHQSLLKSMLLGAALGGAGGVGAKGLSNMMDPSTATGNGQGFIHPPTPPPSIGTEAFHGAIAHPVGTGLGAWIAAHAIQPKRLAKGTVDAAKDVLGTKKEDPGLKPIEPIPSNIEGNKHVFQSLLNQKKQQMAVPTENNQGNAKATGSSGDNMKDTVNSWLNGDAQSKQIAGLKSLQDSSGSDFNMMQKLHDKGLIPQQSLLNDDPIKNDNPILKDNENFNESGEKVLGLRQAVPPSVANSVQRLQAAKAMLYNNTVKPVKDFYDTHVRGIDPFVSPKELDSRRADLSHKPGIGGALQRGAFDSMPLLNKLTGAAGRRDVVSRNANVPLSIPMDQLARGKFVPQEFGPQFAKGTRRGSIVPGGKAAFGVGSGVLAQILKHIDTEQLSYDKNNNFMNINELLPNRPQQAQIPTPTK